MDVGDRSVRIVLGKLKAIEHKSAVKSKIK